MFKSFNFIDGLHGLKGSLQHSTEFNELVFPAQTQSFGQHVALVVRHPAL